MITNSRAMKYAYYGMGADANIVKDHTEHMIMEITKGTA